MRQRTSNAPKLVPIKKRADFLRLRAGEFQRPKGFFLQAHPNSLNEIRVGFTASKKIGNAVTRNRAKRRLRAVANDVILTRGKAGWDYVMIARAGTTLTRDYDKLVADVKWALHQIHEDAP